MVWSLALDDFGKSCKSSQRPYPLISTIKDELIRAEKGFTGKPTKRMTTKMTRMTTKSRPTTQTSTPEPPYPDDGTYRLVALKWQCFVYIFNVNSTCTILTVQFV